MLFSLPLQGASLDVDVRTPHGTPVHEAVVYAIPEDHAVLPAKRTAIMDQKNRMFVPHVLAIQTGTAVRFPNSDDIRHQVYSFSSAKKFELPLYQGTPAKPIVFDKPGVVTLGCNIHDRMSAYIVIVDTPYFAKSENGRAALPNLAAGRYSVHVWSQGMRGEPAPITVTLGVTDRKELKFVTR